MRQALKPLLFDDDDQAAAEAARPSIVAPAQRSPRAKAKAATKRTEDGLPVHSFQTLLADLATHCAVTLCILSSNTWNLEGVPIADVTSWATMATLHHVLCGGANGVGVEHCRIKLPGGTRHHLRGFEEATRDEPSNHPRLLEFPKSLARLECALGELAC